MVLTASFVSVDCSRLFVSGRETPSPSSAIKASTLFLIPSYFRNIAWIRLSSFRKAAISSDKRAASRFHCPSRNLPTWV